MNTNKYLVLLSKCCHLHEEALLAQRSATDVDKQITELLKIENDRFFQMISILIKCFRGETRKDGSSRTLHAYDVARIALEGLNFLHPLILKTWEEKHSQTVLFSALAHDLLEDGIGMDKEEITRLFSQEISDVVFELTVPSQKSYNESSQLFVKKFSLFSIESASLYPNSPLPDNHFHLAPSVIGAYVKLCDIVSSLRANIVRGIPGWSQEKYHQLIMNFGKIVKNISSLNSFVWHQFEQTSYQLKDSWNK